MNSQNQALIRTAAWILLGLILGASFGLMLGWLVWPTQFTEADPTVLEEKYQRDYTLMTASAYWVEKDLEFAKRRLQSLGKEDYLSWYRGVTIDSILNDADETQILHLVKLAADLGIHSPAMEPYWPGNIEVDGS